jgi:hypothetical protein
VVSTHLGELIQHHGLLGPLGLPIAGVNRAEILLLGLSRHAVGLHAPSLGPFHVNVEGKIGKWRNDLSLGNILDGAIRDIE